MLSIDKNTLISWYVQIAKVVTFFDQMIVTSTLHEIIVFNKHDMDKFILNKIGVSNTLISIQNSTT